MCDDDDDTCCCMSRENSDRAFVVVVIFLISFGFFSYITLIVIPLKWWSTPFGIANLSFLFSTFYLLCYNYYKSITTSPGFVKKGWTDTAASEADLAWAKSEESKNPNKFLDPTTFYKPRWCPYCQSNKPPRSHHCKELGRCVLKMDHYCPWVYNAVGYKNHKYFALFLIYATTALSYHLICCTIRLYYMIYNFKVDNRGPPDFKVSEIVMFVCQFVLVLPVTAAIGSLLVYQLSCIWSGVTSIETYLEKQYKKGSRKSGRPFRWFYDYGFFYNLKQIFGPHFYTWGAASAQSHLPPDGGLSFKTRRYDPNAIPPAPEAETKTSEGSSPVKQPDQKAKTKKGNVKTKTN